MTRDPDSPVPRPRESSDAFVRTANRVKAARDLVLAITLFGTIVVGSVLTFQELRNKPSTEDVREQIVTTIKPVEEQGDENRSDLISIKRSLGRMKKVQSFQLEQAAWQMSVLQHVAEKRKGPAPRKPDELRRLERELIR